ncbi:MAG: FecR family protein [Bacteroidetes bacterium]|nr:FecR family protein [Bacteroidota bacterium]
MTRIKELIKKLWEGKISSLESRELENLINQDSGDFRKDLEKQFYSDIDKKEQQAIRSGSAKIIPFRKWYWQVAASLLLALLLMEFFFSRDRITEPKPITADRVVHTSVSEIVYRKNSAAVDMNIQLPDGSEVTLSEGSSIRYKKQFDAEKRDVYLTGKAYFKVKKNPAKPFSVLTADFSTMALGTEFEVNTFGHNKLVVRLFSGKVKVYAPDYISSFDAIYLTPGEQVSINTKDRSVNVIREFTTDDLQLAKEKVPVKKLNDLNFQNEPLASVFNKLSVIYNTPVKYDAEQIEGLYFTGSVLPTDQLNNILTLIANMNGLVATYVDDHFVIRKK